jgi:hypothetical protein
MKKTALLLMFFIFLLLFSCKKKENQIIDNANNIITENNTEQEKYLLKNIYDISGQYYLSSLNEGYDGDLMIDYGNKTLYLPYTRNPLDIDTMELIDNNIYKMTFNGWFHEKTEVPIILIIEILEQDKIKIDCFITRDIENFPDYSNELNGTFYRFKRYKKTNFTPTHILKINFDTSIFMRGTNQVKSEEDDDKKFTEMIIRRRPDKKPFEIMEFPRRLKSGAVVQLLEIGQTETIEDITADWYKIRTNLDREGWIFSAYLYEFNETVTQNKIKKPLENPDRQKIIGKWINEDHFGKEWNFYGDGTFDFSLIAHSIVGKWMYESNRIFIKEPVDIILEETESRVKRNGFCIDVEIIDDNNMIFFNSECISEHFGFGYQDGKYIKFKK